MNMKHTIAATLMVLGLSISAGACQAATLSGQGGGLAENSSATSITDSHVGKRVYVKLRAPEDERSYHGLCVAQDAISISVKLDNGNVYQLFFDDIEYIQSN